MDDGYDVSLPALDDLAQSLANGQQVLRDSADPMLRAAGRISTGDPGLDAETENLISGVNNLFGRIADALGRTGDAVLAAADNYQDGDARAAAGYQQLTPDGQDADA
jgi:uncharacterized phage infection (PIP) family protein YhgE